MKKKVVHKKAGPRNKNKYGFLGNIPGTPVFTGAPMGKKAGNIDLVVYNARECREFTNLTPGELKEKRKTLEGIFWIDVKGLDDSGMINAISEEFNIHPITMEGVLDVYQSPRLEELDHYLFYSFKFLQVGKSITSDHLSLILGENFVVSFSQETDFSPVKERLMGNKGRIRRMGGDYLFYSLIDLVMDSYFVELEKITDAFDRIDDQLMEEPCHELLVEIHSYRPHLRKLRRIIFPLQEMNNLLLKEDFDFISDDISLFLRNLYDHTLRIVEMVEMLRDGVSGLMELYLSSVSNKMNEVMEVLTTFASIFIPLTFMTGWYGMNFHHMPELGQPLGYPLFIFAIALTAGTMIFYFHKKGWIGKKRSRKDQ